MGANIFAGVPSVSWPSVWNRRIEKSAAALTIWPDAVKVAFHPVGVSLKALNDPIFSVFDILLVAKVGKGVVCPFNAE